MNLILKFLSKGHERSVRAKRNIIGLFLIKGYSLGISLALIPITLKLLDDYKYGVWITLFNVLSWISIFDIGIGNGLRNKFAESIARNKIKEAREFVSTAYVLMLGISISLVFFFIVPWLVVDWGKVFNVGSELSHEVYLLIGIAFLMTSLQFSLKLINTLLNANHQPVVSALVGTINSTLILLLFLVSGDFLKDNLLGIGFIYTSIPLLVLAIASFIIFNTSFKKVRPSLRFYRKGKVKGLFNLGIQFFVIQIAVVVIFTTDSMIITHVLSPKEVTSYNIVLRYFGVVTMLAGIIMTPFWSAYTEAAAKDDYAWIRRTLKKQLQVMLVGTGILTILLLAISSFLIPVWLQENIELSFTLLIGMAGYTIISVWNNIFSFLLNGLSIIKVQLYASIAGTVVNIPLSIYLGRELGNGGVILATIISLSFFAIFGSYQSFVLLKEKNG